MTLHAIDDVGDALDAMRAFLLPIDTGKLARLALVALFAAGPATNLSTVQFNASTGGSPASDGPATTALPDLSVLGDPFWPLVAGLAAAAALLALVGLFVGSVMEFVLVESLRRESVSVRRYWGRRWRQGVRLFGFRLVLALFVLGGVGALAAAVVFPGAVGGAPGVSIAVLVLLAPVFVLLALLVGLAYGFTTVFVVPVMVVEDCGVLAAWRRLWSAIAAEPAEFLAYAVLGALLSAVGGVAVGVGVGVAAVALLLPFGVLGAAGFLLLSTVGPIGGAVLLVVGVAFGVAVLAAFALAKAAVVTYLRYYALFVLGDVDAELDLVPERRAAVRGEAEPAG